MSFNFTIPELQIDGAGTPPLQFFRRGFNLTSNGASPSWQDIILSGNGSLTLTNAKSNGLNYVKLYGGCTQASTPTPDTPVDIVCNNGALKMVDDELPAGYKRVLGYECDNNVLWRITNFKLRGSDTVRISFSVTGACNVFGCYQGADATDNYDLYASITSGSKWFRYGNGTYLSYFSNNNLNKRFDVVFTPNGSQGMPQDSTWSPETFESANDLIIGSTSLTGTSAKLKGNLYGNFEVDNRLKIIPCERLSDNSLGYYDTYSETFFEPTGTPTSMGYDGSHYVLTIDGTTETVQLHGKNLSNGALENIGYTSTGGTSTSSTFCGNLCKIKVKAGEKYTVSCGNFPDGISGVFVNTWKVDGSWNMRQAIAMSTSYTYTIPEGIGEVNFTLYKTGGINIGSTSWLQVEKGDTATTYEPYYSGGSATAEMLLKVGDYQDVQSVIDGQVTRKVGVKVLNGTEDWGAEGTLGTNNYRFTFMNINTTDNAESSLCTHIDRIIQGSETSQSNRPCIRFNTSGTALVWYETDNTTTLEQFKQFLADQYANGTPVILLYPLATATTESVTGQPLTIQAGTNVVAITQASIDNLGLEVSYKGTV